MPQHTRAQVHGWLAVAAAAASHNPAPAQKTNGTDRSERMTGKISTRTSADRLQKLGMLQTSSNLFLEVFVPLLLCGEIVSC